MVIMVIIVIVLKTIWKMIDDSDCDYENVFMICKMIIIVTD